MPTRPSDQTAPQGHPGDPETAHASCVEAISTELIRHLRLAHLLKAHVGTWLPPGVDWGAATLLAQLVRGGPRRQGELADGALLDPSTVSRHVGQLVQRGLAERQADPADGRAVRIAATPAGHELFHLILRRRVEVMQRVLAGWTEEDLETFHRLLRRLDDDLEGARPLLGRPGAFPPDRPH